MQIPASFQHVIVVSLWPHKLYALLTFEGDHERKMKCYEVFQKVENFPIYIPYVSVSRRGGEEIVSPPCTA